MTEETIEHCKKCGHIGFLLIAEPEESVHNAKIVCADCGAFQKWTGKPRTDLSDLGRWAVYDTKNTGSDEEPKFEGQEWRFNFGKYKGESIKGVMRTNKGSGYCVWLITKADFNEKCPSLIDLIEEIAEEEGIQLDV